MSQLVVLNLGKGDWQQGFPTVIAQLWETDSPTPVQFTGSLPAAPEIGALYQRWQLLYETLYSNRGWRRHQSQELEIEIDEADVTYVSQADFNDLCQELQNRINTWLNAEQFRHIDRQLRTRLAPKDEIRFIAIAQDRQVLRLPWSLWHFFEDYPKAEIALSPPEYTRSLKAAAKKPSGSVKILAILGNRRGIDVNKDQYLLEQLPNAEVKFLVEPTLKELNLQLWELGWDILFFAGHSSSQGKGKVQLNSQDSITIEQLKYGLRKAIEHGLKLAIFNSCDGLGLAWDLADLHLPQVIVMREPVPDLVAQEFLKHFLTAFSRGQSLYAAVREAREKLQAIEPEFPCATWLPVICQNPAEVPPTWQEWCGDSGVGVSFPGTPSQEIVERSPTPFPRHGPRQLRGRHLQTVLLNSVAIAGLLVGVRWLGMLQALEIQAFDYLMRLRPQEAPDPRLLVVTVTEKDIQAQGEQPRRGSLSDKTLNQLLEKLEQYQPQAIGLDIYRDFPVSPNRQDLATRLRQSDRLIAVCKRKDSEQDPTGIPPPPEISEARLGFSDFVQDRDGFIRRHLLFMSRNPVSSPCTAAYAFSVQLAFRYLDAKGIRPKFTSEGDLQLGNTVFQSLKSRTGGYQPVDALGSQVLLNYRSSSSPQNIASKVTVAEVLSGQLNPNAVKDRVILIGVTATSGGDYWSTPYGAGFLEKMPGVLIQAQMVSQILSAVLDRRPLLWVWPLWAEVLWIWGWSVAGGLLAWRCQRLAHLGLAGGIAVGTLSGLCLVILTQGGWVPLVPSMFALVATGGKVAYTIFQCRKS